MLWKSCLRLLKEDPLLLEVSLEKRYSRADVLPLPRHLTTELLSSNGTSTALSTAADSQVSLLRVGKQLRRKWNSSWLWLDGAVLGFGGLDHLMGAVRVLIITGSIRVKYGDWKGVLGPLLTGCEQLHLSAPLSDESFLQLGKKMPELLVLNLQGSGVDLMQMPLAVEMRRWSRKLRSLAFNTSVALSRVIRILVRQCPLLEELDLSREAGGGGEISTSSTVKVETHHCIKRLVVRNNSKLTTQGLIDCLQALPKLELLDVRGCHVDVDIIKTIIDARVRVLFDDFGECIHSCK